jgi:hypothetical protein
MKTTHTPGEWMQETESTVKGNFAIFERNTDTHIATVHNIGAEAEANAKVIAAAPDLLNALQNALAVLEQTDLSPIPGLYDTLQWVEMEQAIQKATE